MNDLYDLSNIIPVETIPWEELYTGIAKSVKYSLLYYGYYDKAIKGSDGNYLSLEQAEWYKSVKYGDNLKGLGVVLRQPKDSKTSWYTLGESKNWYDTENCKHFPELIKWINNSDIFTETGRILFFIQLIGTHTPPHVDDDLSKAPAEYQKRAEFIWLTDPNNPKQLVVNGKSAGNFAWFNNYKTHTTLPSNTTKFSLRIDGKFTENFKKKLDI